MIEVFIVILHYLLIMTPYLFITDTNLKLTEVINTLNTKILVF